MSHSSEQLRAEITAAVCSAGVSEITYRSEWLGYLPYGAYQWLVCTGRDINLSVDWSLADLTALEQSGFLKEIHRQQNPDDTDALEISYRVLHD